MKERKRKTFPGEFQHGLVIADIEMNNMQKVVKTMYIEQRKISLLKDEKLGMDLKKKCLTSQEYWYILTMRF